MNNDVKSEKYRKLSTAALVIGILGLSPIVLYNFLWMPISNFLRSFVEPNIITNIILPFIAAALGLSIAAVVCGSIDLNKIKKRLYSNKGKGFDIAGIVMGGVIILFAMIFALGEIIVPHEYLYLSFKLFPV